MKIVTYNIQFGLGKDERFDLQRIASEVDGADIIALQEVERYWHRSGNVDQVARLGAFLDQYYWVYGPYFDVDASTAGPAGVISNVRRQFGNMILSKTPIISTRLFPLPKTALPERHNMVVGVFEGVVKLPKGGALRIYNAHLSARSRQDRMDQIIAIRDIISHAPAQGGAWTGEQVHSLWAQDATPAPMPEPFVLLGDFNLEAKDPEYNLLAGPSGGDGGGASPAQHLIDTWVASGHHQNEGITYCQESGASDCQGMRIDYGFVDQTMQKWIVGTWIDQQARGSDHQPYWIELDYGAHD